MVAKKKTRARGRKAMILGGVRTPFIKADGAFEPNSATDLGRIAMLEGLAAAGVDPEQVDHVVMGCAGGPSDSANPARVAALRAGIPNSVPALTVQRNCASGMEAIAQAVTLVETGRADVVLCGGMESMSNYGFEFPRSFRRKLKALSRARSVTAKAALIAGLRPTDFKPEIGLLKGLTDPVCGLNMGQTAEVLARELGISRDEQDAYALMSHERVLAAQAERLNEEIIPVIPQAGPTQLRDDAVREDQSLERLGRLKPAFEKPHGTVTPGNSCGLTDGACALLVVDGAWAKEHAKSSGIKPLARVVSHVAAGVAPQRMGLGPTAALPRALARADWELADLDLVEINEAFAVQVLACRKVLADEELMRRHADWPVALGELDEELLNVNGGAIALGHPVGVSGARIVLTLALEMRRRNASRGAASLCVGGGQGQAVLLEA